MNKSAGGKNPRLQSGLMKNSIRILAIVCIVIAIAFLADFVM